MAINGFHNKITRQYAHRLILIRKSRRQCLSTLAKLQDQVNDHKVKLEKISQPWKRHAIQVTIDEIKSDEIKPRYKKLALLNKQIRYLEERIMEQREK